MVVREAGTSRYDGDPIELTPSNTSVQYYCDVLGVIGDLTWAPPDAGRLLMDVGITDGYFLHMSCQKNYNDLACCCFGRELQLLGAGVSRHHGAWIKRPPETPRTSRYYVSNGPQLSPIIHYLIVIKGRVSWKRFRFEFRDTKRIINLIFFNSWYEKLLH